MSRIGKRPIQIPSKTEVTVDGNVVTVKGPLGELKRSFNKFVKISVGEEGVQVSPADESLDAKAFWGTYASHIKNMIAGVNEHYKKALIIEGVGYKANVVGENVVLNIGFSHPVSIKIPEGIKCEIEKENIRISGIDKEVVGEFAATLRSKKKPEPYKGKGIRYAGEIIRRKEGKKAL
jgi:large subunit ribosomal protein L6